MIILYSQFWVGGRVQDSTEIGVVSLDSEVSTFSPGGSPGVLDEPVVSSTVSSVSDGEDTMVESLSTEMLDDSTEVELEMSSINSDRNWSNVKSGLQLVNRFFNIMEASNFKDTLG